MSFFLFFGNVGVEFSCWFFFYHVVQIISCYFRLTTSTTRRMAERAVQKLILQIQTQEAWGLMDER